MKKSVIVLIGVIYAASIVLVTFFGLQYSTYQPEEIPVSEIKITNNGLKIDESDGSKYIVFFTPDENGNRTFQVEYTVTPDDASNPAVDFVMDSPYATVDENGLVTFTKVGSAILYIYSTDGTRKSDSIEITFLS
ncbi:MAG: hypothetical protein IJX92_01675 [Clostridia bacterium]|nr:hypothetical protein [Clostridia bacterium]